MRRPLRVGIIGCGVTGSVLAKYCVRYLKKKVRLVALYDIDAKKPKMLVRLLGLKEIAVSSYKKVIEGSELVIEAASSEVSRKFVEEAVRKGKDILVMSIGGLIDAYSVFEKARRKNTRIYLPSGAICGIDGLKSARLSKIKKVTLTTRKPPKGLEGAPYLEKKKIDINAIKKETVIFEGDAYEAVKAFPKNINVASLLSIAGLGGRKTIVRVITSPFYSRNTHEVEVEGDFGRILARTENVPSEENPKTSKLASLSAIATLKSIVDSVKVGT